MSLSRRQFVIGLSALVPASYLLSPNALAQSTHSEILKVSQIIVGRTDLDPGIAERIEKVLSSRLENFAAKLSTLARALGDGSDRNAALTALDEANLELALKIAEPWYVGVIGNPAMFTYEDDAVFVTYLGNQSQKMVEHVMPLPSYSTGTPGWWADVPTGVTAPEMPGDILDWAFVPEGADGSIADADPAFVTLVSSSPGKR